MYFFPSRSHGHHQPLPGRLIVHTVLCRDSSVAEQRCNPQPGLPSNDNRLWGGHPRCCHLVTEHSHMKGWHELMGTVVQHLSWKCPIRTCPIFLISVMMLSCPGHVQEMSRDMSRRHTHVAALSGHQKSMMSCPDRTFQNMLLEVF
jgi:hypothetical protein